MVGDWCAVCRVLPGPGRGHHPVPRAPATREGVGSPGGAVVVRVSRLPACSLSGSCQRKFYMITLLEKHTYDLTRRAQGPTPPRSQCAV